MKILAIQLYRIGDVLLTTPAVRAIKESFPEATVDFMAENPAAEILMGNRDIGEILIYDKKRPWAMIRGARARHYDWVIDFLGTPRSALVTALSGAKMKAGPNWTFHRWAYNRKLPRPPGSLYVAEEKIRFLKPLGVRLIGNLRAAISIPESSRLWAGNFIKSREKTRCPLIALSPVSRRHFNRWPLLRYAALAERLISELQGEVLILWGPGEKDNAVTIASQMTKTPLVSPETKGLLDMAALLERADLYVGNDNGVKHIAAAVGIPTFTIYGPHSPVSWTYPDPANHRFIQKSCPCREQSRNEHACAQTPCLQAISVEEVFDGVKNLWEDIRKKPAHLVK